MGVLTENLPDQHHRCSKRSSVLQANQRIIDAAASRLDIPSYKVILNLANYGNISAAFIPLALMRLFAVALVYLCWSKNLTSFIES
jgi:hypothetical protein